MSTPTRIPILDLTPEIELLWDDLNTAFQRVLRSGQFIGGPEVEAFEREAADYLGTKHAVGVNSGTDALVIGLRALGIGPGDEVITTPFTFFATGESIANVGATPVFVDIDENSFNIDPSLIEDAITPRTKAILPVHLFGRPCDMDAVMGIAERHGLKVVEDAAQSFGARLGGQQSGTFGHVGAFSFFPSKNLGAFGDAGLLATDDDEVAESARMLRAHGSRTKYYNETLGYNSRLDSLQAAFLRVKLPHVDTWNERRRAVAATYDALLGSVHGLRRPAFVAGHVFHQYTVRVGSNRRDDAKAELDSRGIGSAIYYPVALDGLQPFRRSSTWSFSPEHTEATRAASTVLSLPIGPSLSAVEQHRIADVLTSILGRE
jgi:dTDP-4-amino-4,6-dideoxygalactose transaminase